MRFYTKQHQFYCGIDLHARTMYRLYLEPGLARSCCTGICQPAQNRFSRPLRPIGTDSGRRCRMHLHLVLAGRPLCP